MIGKSVCLYRACLYVSRSADGVSHYFSHNHDVVL